MNKKFLSAILFGALMVTSTGTFVSCKDYDDDIKELQDQINSQKSELTGKVSSLESSISSLQTAQSSLQSEIAKVTDAAEKAALEAQAAAIAAAKADLEAAVATLKEAGAAELEKVNAAVALVKGNVEALQAFQKTSEETLKALAAADGKLDASLKELDAEVAANATAIGKLETAVDAQIKALEEYVASNDESVAANKTAIDAVTADLKKLQDTVAGLKIADPEGLAEAAAAIEAAKGEIAKLSTAVQTIDGDLELISSAVYTGVTHVSLAEVSDMREALNLVSVEAVTDYVFGENLPGAVTFVKGNVETFEQEIMVRVSPTNANLDKEMIKIVDSKLNNLAGLVDILEVKPYTGQLAGRAISENGLWTIKLKLVDNYDKTAYRNAAYNANGRPVNYAVMVNNTSVAERQVVSEYGITLGGLDKLSRYDLAYTVNNNNVDKIMNRWDGAAPTTTENGGTTTYKEAVWNLAAKTYKAIDRIYVYNHAPFITPNWTEFNKGNQANNVNVWQASHTMEMINPVTNDLDWNGARNSLKSDARSNELALRVDAEKNVAVKMTNVANVRAFYVTLDQANAVESAPSELVAWQSYNIQGLNEVKAGNETVNLVIPSIANGDYIGFRVYAVNFDGTLVDPDGRAFYVYVGEQTTVAAEMTLTMDEMAGWNHDYIFTPWAAAYQEYATNGWGRAEGGTYEITFSASDDVSSNAGIQYYDNTNNMVEDKIYDMVGPWHFVFKNSKNENVTVFNNQSNQTNNRTMSGKLSGTAASLNSVVKIGMSNVPASALRDNVTYFAKITIKGANAQVIGSSTIAFTKELPGFPVNVAPATGMLQNGNVMVFPDQFSNGKAFFDMDGAFEGLNTSANITFQELNNPSIGLGYDHTNEIVSIDAKYVNPASGVYGKVNSVRYRYNYGPISNAYQAATQNWSGVQNWITNYPFTLQFGNYYHETTMTLTPFTINYPGAKDKEAVIELSNIEIRDWYNQIVDLKKAVNKVSGTKEAKYLSAPATITFITDNTAKPEDEYYKFGYFGKAQYDAAGDFVGYAKVGDTYKVYNENGREIKSYTLTLEDCDVMVVMSQKDSFTGGSVPTKIRVTYKDNFGNTIKKTSTNSFTMNFQQ